MKKYYSLIILLIMASCTHKQEAMLSPEEEAKTDNLTLRIAVMPVMDCLPVYYAQRTGLMEEIDLHAEVETYAAQMDIDTTLEKGHVDVAYSDLIRAVRLMPKVDSLRAFMAGQEQLTLISQKGKRVKKENQLKEKMIAMCRLSVTDYWCDVFTENLKLSEENVYRPQVNDVQLRTDMLRTNLIDAGIYPDPYASWMLGLGHRKIEQTRNSDPQMTAWVVRSDSTFSQEKEKQMERFMQAYNLAVENINRGLLRDSINVILRDIYKIPAHVAASLELPKYAHASAPKEENLTRAVDWLKGRKRLPRGAHTEELITTKYTNE